MKGLRSRVVHFPGIKAALFCHRKVIPSVVLFNCFVCSGVCYMMSCLVSNGHNPESTCFTHNRIYVLGSLESQLVHSILRLQGQNNPSTDRRCANNEFHEKEEIAHFSGAKQGSGDCGDERWQWGSDGSVVWRDVSYTQGNYKASTWKPVQIPTLGQSCVAFLVCFHTARFRGLKSFDSGLYLAEIDTARQNPKFKRQHFTKNKIQIDALFTAQIHTFAVSLWVPNSFHNDRWNRQFGHVTFRIVLVKHLPRIYELIDQFQITPAASPDILHHTVWRTWLFIAYSDERWLYYQFSLPHLYIISP